MNTMTDAETRLEREITIAAPPAIVFAHLVDPERIVRWMGRTAELDAHVGGAWRVDYNGTDIVTGQVLELDPPRRLVLSWGWEAPDQLVGPGGSTVEFELTADGTGTRLRMRHLGLPPSEIAGHAEGWDYFLPRLVEAVTTA